jgi:hypothetical protein
MAATTRTAIKGTSITQPTADGANHALVLGQLKETTEIAQRLRGDPNDSFVRVSELINATGARLVNNTVQPPNSTNSSAVSVAVAGSIMGTGLSANPLQLVGDSASPGNNMAYSTNGSGVKGWYAAGGGGGGSLTVTDGTHSVASTTQITFAGAVVSGSSPNAVVTISGGGSTPIPGTIPDLILWVETDDINVSVGNTVSRISDRTPWTLGVVASSVSPPTISATQLNSLNVLSFLGGQIYTIGSPFSTPNQTTIFAVVRPNTTSSNEAVYGSASNGGVALYIQISSVPSVALVKSGLAVIGTSSASWTAGTAFQCNATYVSSTGAYAFRVARTAAGSGTGATLAGTGPQGDIGGDLGSAGLNGDLAALIVYNRVLTGPEITSVENYLFTKWGV